MLLARITSRGGFACERDPYSSQTIVSWPGVIPESPGSLAPLVPAARGARRWLTTSCGVADRVGPTLLLFSTIVWPPKVTPPSDDAITRIRFGSKLLGGFVGAVSIPTQAT